MKRLLILLFVGLGLTATTQAQGVVDVQNDDGVVRAEVLKAIPTLEVQLNNVFANANLESTKIVSFEYETTPELDSVIVITNSNAVAELIESNIGFKERVVNKNGLRQYTMGNLLDNQILKERLLLATTNGSVSTHRVRYLS